MKIDKNHMYFQTKFLVESQLANFFPDKNRLLIDDNVFEYAYEKTSKCVDSIKGWNEKGFDSLVSWQYATFLYFLSRHVFQKLNQKELATKLFLLNKALNSFELYFEINLPNYFFLSHTPGLVFGQATYGDYCIFHQGCTVGRNGLDRPILENGVVMYPNSSIIGNCLIRSNSVISPGVQIVNQDTPGNCYVFSEGGGRLIFKDIKEFYADRYFYRTN